jgi:hypothetical protein
MTDLVRVSYASGSATVRIGAAGLTVEPRANDERSAVCPIELVSAALGT